MTSTILLPLHADETPPGSVRLTELPAFARPAYGSSGAYWHLPRSAWQWTDRPDRDLDVIHCTFWCGQIGMRYASEFTSAPPRDWPICGTCVGRREGFDGRGRLTFAPRDPFALPTRCPGIRWAPGGVCEVCGIHVRAAYGWNGHGTAKHRPGPGIERYQPCPNHGWRGMSTYGYDGMLVCTKYACEHRVPLR